MADERSANAIDRRIGQRVRARRLELGVSQERLADILGVTFQQVQKYEKGTNRIAASRLFDIAAALDMPAARFFEGLSSGDGVASTKHGSSDDILATPEGSQLVALFGELKSAKVRQRVLKLVRVLVEAG